MQKQIIVTADGSHTVMVPEMNVTYHSIHGAIQESRHVFIAAGLDYLINGPGQTSEITILEMGFGTGLNAILTLAAIQNDRQCRVHYTGIELYPLLKEEYEGLNYCTEPLYRDFQEAFQQMHHCPWEEDVVIDPLFTLFKTRQSLLQFNTARQYNLVYFDAFAPAAQPELWTKQVFDLLHDKMHKGGVLVTYCSKGDVRRNLLAAGFTVEKIPGPPRKREMLRAEKK